MPRSPRREPRENGSGIKNAGSLRVRFGLLSMGLASGLVVGFAAVSRVSLVQPPLLLLFGVASRSLSQQPQAGGDDIIDRDVKWIAAAGGPTPARWRLAESGGKPLPERLLRSRRPQ
jgi:hypothetical protein